MHWNVRSVSHRLITYPKPRSLCGEEKRKIATVDVHDIGDTYKQLPKWQIGGNHKIGPKGHYSNPIIARRDNAAPGTDAVD